MMSTNNDNLSISLQDYLLENKDSDNPIPYLNAISNFVPDKGKERTNEDDKPLVFDISNHFTTADVSERIHLTNAKFDEIFSNTLIYFETTEYLLYKAIQKGEKDVNYLNSELLNYLNRNYPELIKFKVDTKQMIKRLDVAICGYYVLQPLIDHPDTTDIKICSPSDIRVRIKGKAYSSSGRFLDVNDLYKFIDGLCLRNGVNLYSSPVITFTDDHDKNYILRFVISSPTVNAVPYPYMHIRKVPKTKPSLFELTTTKHNCMVTPPMKDYLINRAKWSRGIVFAGPPGSGKSTLLNAFIEFIPRTRETLVIQENDELFTSQPGFMFKHVSHGYDGSRPYSLEDLGKMALVEGCNEFIIGEVKGGEMRNVMTLLNAGGYAALTVHSTNAYETMDKLADLVKYGSSYSFEEARRMLKTFDTIVYMEGYKVRQILQVQGYDDDTKQFIYLPIFKYDETKDPMTFLNNHANTLSPNNTADDASNASSLPSSNIFFE